MTKTRAAARLVKKEHHKVPKIQATIESAVDPKEWSTSVKSWVSEFQQNRSEESLQAFDSLFKDVVPDPEVVD
jgi:hypothetical protein